MTSDNNCPLPKDSYESMIAQRSYDDLNNAFKYNRAATASTTSTTSASATIGTSPANSPHGVNYLYLSTIRGGSMENKENFCDTCMMKGGCFTCPKGKTKLSAHFNIIVINLPKLYKKYKTSSSKKMKALKKGGDSKGDNAIDMGKIGEVSYLPLSKYKEYQPFDLQAQLFL
jgi:hypothetical protein